MKRTLSLAAVGLATALLTSACGTSSNPLSSAATSSGSSTSHQSVVVGSANFPENIVLADIYAQALQSKGVTVTTKLNIGSRPIIFNQISKGALSILPEYNGALLAFLKPNTTVSSTAAVNAQLKAALPSDLEVLNSSAAQDKDSITCNAQTVAKYHLHSIANLAPVASKLTLGAGPGFNTRHEGLLGLKSVYGVQFGNFKALDISGPLTVAALKSNEVQCADVFTTDPVIVQNHFVTLTDPKSLFSSQNVTPLVYKPAATPVVVNTLNAVSAKLTTAGLLGMMKQIVLSQQDPSSVAHQWLVSEHLIA